MEKRVVVYRIIPTMFTAHPRLLYKDIRCTLADIEVVCKGALDLKVETVKRNIALQLIFYTGILGTTLYYIVNKQNFFPMCLLM